MNDVSKVNQSKLNIPALAQLCILKFFLQWNITTVIGTTKLYFNKDVC